MIGDAPLLASGACSDGCAVSGTIYPRRQRTSETRSVTAWPLRPSRHPRSKIRPLSVYRRLGAPIIARMILHPRRPIRLQVLEVVCCCGARSATRKGRSQQRRRRRARAGRCAASALKSNNHEYRIQ